MDGLILVHKPPKLTSHDVVDELRKIFGVRKVGHFGTLDPMATGLLLVGVGSATRLFPYFSKETKVYSGQIRLGYSTDTFDSDGTPTSLEILAFPDREKLSAAIKKMEGAISQTPPPYSAKKYRGKPLYAFARANKEVQSKPQEVFVHFFRLIRYAPPFVDFEVKCTSGTYIRSIADDLGKNLGCRGHLCRLTRTRVGPYQLEDSFTLEELQKIVPQGKAEDYLIPLEALLVDFPKFTLKDSDAALVKHGQSVSKESFLEPFPETLLSSKLPDKEQIVRLFTKNQKLLALARQIPEKNCFHPFLVLDCRKTGE